MFLHLNQIKSLIISFICLLSLLILFGDKVFWIDKQREIITKIKLPQPNKDGMVSFEKTLSSRRSVRNYLNEQITESETSQLLWALQGITDKSGFRTTPSAGALYPLEIYLAKEDGLFFYQPGEHLLLQIGNQDLRRDIFEVTLRQEALASAPQIFIICGVEKRTAQKYGSRAGRYVAIEAGMAAQNLLLQATALGLGAVPIGAFEDNDLRAVLSLPDGQKPLLVVPVGKAIIQ